MDKPTVEQVAWVFKNICDNAEKGTFRYLIYDRMGFESKDYETLYRAGGMFINNSMNCAFAELDINLDDFDFTKAYVENKTLIIPMRK